MYRIFKRDTSEKVNFHFNENMNCGCYILSYVDLQKEAGMNNGASGWGDHETWTSFSFASSDLDEEDENKEVKEARYVQCLPALGGGGGTKGYRVKGHPDYNKLNLFNCD